MFTSMVGYGKVVYTYRKYAAFLPFYDTMRLEVKSV